MNDSFFFKIILLSKPWLPTLWKRLNRWIINNYKISLLPKPQLYDKNYDSPGLMSNIFVPFFIARVKIKISASLGMNWIRKLLWLSLTKLGIDAFGEGYTGTINPNVQISQFYNATQSNWIQSLSPFRRKLLSVLTVKSWKTSVKTRTTKIFDFQIPF